MKKNPNDVEKMQQYAEFLKELGLYEEAKRIFYQIKEIHVGNFDEDKITKAYSDLRYLEELRHGNLL